MHSRVHRRSRSRAALFHAATETRRWRADGPSRSALLLCWRWLARRRLRRRIPASVDPRHSARSAHPDPSHATCRSTAWRTAPRPAFVGPPRLEGSALALVGVQLLDRLGLVAVVQLTVRVGLPPSGRSARELSRSGRRRRDAGASAVFGDEVHSERPQGPPDRRSTSTGHRPGRWRHPGLPPGRRWTAEATGPPRGTARMARSDAGFVRHPTGAEVPALSSQRSLCRTAHREPSCRRPP